VLSGHYLIPERHIVLRRADPEYEDQRLGRLVGDRQYAYDRVQVTSIFGRRSFNGAQFFNSTDANYDPDYTDSFTFGYDAIDGTMV